MNASFLWQRLDPKTGSLHLFHHGLLSSAVCFHREYFVFICGVYRPVGNAFRSIQKGRYFGNTALAFDIGFKLEFLMCIFHN